MITKRKLRWFILINGLVVAFSVLLPQILLRTPLDGDSIAFFPQILEFAKTGALKNPFFNPLAFYGLNPEGYVTWHGFLMPILVGSLIPVKSYPAIIAAIGIIGMIVILVWLKFSLPMVEDIQTAAAVGAATWGLGGWVYGEVGRPESLVSLIVMISLCFTRMTRSWIRTMLLGATIGFCVATSPQAGIIAITLIACFFAATGSDWRGVVGDIIIGGLSAVTVFFACFAFYPFSLIDWLHALSLHAKIAIVERSDFDLKSTLNDQFVRTNQPLFLPWALLGLTGFFYWGRKACTNRILQVAFFAFFTAAVAYGICACHGLLTYNGSPFFALMVVGSVYICTNITIKPLFRRAAFSLVVIMSLIASAPLLVSLGLPTLSRQGMSFRQAHIEIQKLSSRGGGLTISTGLFSLLDSNNGVDTVPPHRIFDQEFVGKGEIFVVQQIFPYKPKPPNYKHYQLIKSFFIDHPVTFVGLRVARSPLGWNFAVYQKKPLSSNGSLQ